MLKPVSLVASGRPRDVSNYFWGGPKASKSAPRGIQERSIRPWKPSSGISSLSKSSKRPLRRRQETSRAHLAAILVPCWSNFAAQSKRCCHHVGHVSSLKAASPRALDPRPKAWRNARERLNNSFRHETSMLPRTPGACQQHSARHPREFQDILKRACFVQ